MNLLQLEQRRFASTVGYFRVLPTLR